MALPDSNQYPTCATCGRVCDILFKTPETNVNLCSTCADKLYPLPTNSDRPAHPCMWRDEWDRCMHWPCLPMDNNNQRGRRTKCETLNNTGVCTPATRRLYDIP